MQRQPQDGARALPQAVQAGDQAEARQAAAVGRSRLAEAELSRVAGPGSPPEGEGRLARLVEALRGE